MDSTNILELLKKKWILAVIGILALAVFLLQFLSSVKPKPEIDLLETVETEVSPTAIPTQPPLPPTTSPFTPEQLQAIEEQRQADEAVGRREVEIRTKFPWFSIKLPLRGDKYFVYFEPNREVFVGLLYPDAADNAEQMKAALIKYLIEVKEIPANSYPFEWTVFPQ